MSPIDKQRACPHNFTNSLRSLCIIMTLLLRFCSFLFLYEPQIIPHNLGHCLKANCYCLASSVPLWFPHEDPLSLDDHHEQSSSLCLPHTDVQPIPKHSVILSDSVTAEGSSINLKSINLLTVLCVES